MTTLAEWKKGYASEMAAAIISHVFKSPGLYEMVSFTLPTNVASRRVMEKCGFEKIGHAPKYLQIQGVWRDHDLYARLAA